MSNRHHKDDWKAPAYGIARDGVAGTILRPLVHNLLDRLSDRITHKVAAIVIGALFLCFVLAGSLDESHRESVVADQRYSQEPTTAHPWRYDIGMYVGRRVWSGERHGLYVSAGDWAQHRFWKAIRTVSGWAFLLAIIAAGVALWRKNNREEAEAAFGGGTEEYDKFLSRPSLEQQDGQDMQKDWLWSGVPQRPTRSGGGCAERPRFGRRR